MPEPIERRQSSEVSAGAAAVKFGARRTTSPYLLS